MIYFSDFDDGGGGSPYGSHRYWRVFITDNHGSATFIALQEVQFKDGAGTIIPATGGTASSSSNAGPGNGPGSAFDGTGSVWATASGTVTNSWIKYAYPSPVAVEQVTLWLGGNDWNRAPKNATLQYSDDDSAWTDAFSFLLELPVCWSERTFPEAPLAPGYHRAWRLFIDDNDSTSSIILDEMELRATAGGADQTANVGSSAGSASGRVIRSADGGGNEGYRVFDNVTNTANYWAAIGQSVNAWVGFIFPEPVKVEEIALTSTNNGTTTRNPKDFKLEYADDGTSGDTWTTQKTFASQTGWSTNETRVLTAI